MKLRLHSNTIENDFANRCLSFFFLVSPIVGLSFSFIIHLNSNNMILWSVLFVFCTFFEIVNLWFEKMHFTRSAIHIENPPVHYIDIIYTFSVSDVEIVLCSSKGSGIRWMTTRIIYPFDIKIESPQRIYRILNFHSLMN